MSGGGGKRVREPGRGHVLMLIAAWMAFALALLTLYTGLATGRVSRYPLYDSDALYLPALYRDAFGPCDVSGWRLPPAPYFFPDMPLYFLIRAAAGDLHVAIVMYGVIQCFLLMVILLFLLRQANGRRSPATPAMLLLGSACLLTLATSSPSEWLRDTLMRMLTSGAHVGTVICMLACLALVVRCLAARIEAGPRRRAYALLLVLGVILTASDFLFVVQFVLPVVMCLLLVALKSPVARRRSVLCFLILGASVILGLGLNGVLVRFESLSLYSMPGATEVGPASERAAYWAGIVWNRHPFLGSVMLVFAAGATVTWLRCLMKESHGPPERRKAFTLIVGWVVLGLPCNLAACLATGHLEPRYFLPFALMTAYFGWPFLLGGMEGPRRWLLRWRRPLIWAGCVTVLGVCLPSLRDVEQLTNLGDYCPDLVRRLDEYADQRGVRNGIAGYWHAKHVSMLSKRGLHVVQVTEDLDAFHWVNNREWYKARFEFAIADAAALTEKSIRARTIRSRFGPPAAEVNIGDVGVLVYDREEDVCFRHQFDGDRQLVDFGRVGESMEIPAYRLPSKTGVSVGLSRVAGPDDPPGYLTYGPYLELPPGVYEFGISYEASQSDGGPAGEWDAVTTRKEAGATASMTLLAAGQLRPTDPEMARGAFALPKQGTVEIRTRFLGRGRLTVHSLMVRRAF